MKNLKLFILFIIAGIFSITEINAQQMPSYTQYMWNAYLINPAVAGTDNFFQIRANSRIQWIGMNEAPRTMSMAMYGPWKDKSMGYGGSIYYDVTGPESKAELNGSYSYNMQVSDFLRISGGISFGIMQYKLDGTRIDMGNEGVYDPAIPGGVESKIIPDASVGVYLWSSWYFVGISAHQLFGNNFDFYNETDSIANPTGVSKLKQNLYLAGGMIYSINRDIQIKPSILVKTVFPDQFQGEISALVTYKRFVWAGLSFRTSDAVSIMAGYNHQSKFYFGLSYDITYSQLRRYTKGTFEIMIGLKFNEIR